VINIHFNVLEKAVDRDNFMSPEEAVEFGLIDKVIDRRDQISEPTSPASAS
jgi:ATP-dependent Clp protease protease subunit